MINVNITNINIVNIFYLILFYNTFICIECIICAQSNIYTIWDNNIILFVSFYMLLLSHNNFFLLIYLLKNISEHYKFVSKY